MKKGFTLIELLVVIAIIALLLSVIIPSLGMAKKKAASAVCMTNVKNLSLAWYLYQEENGGKLMSSRMENVGTQSTARAGWIGAPHTAGDLTQTSLTLAQVSPVVTDEDEIRGIMKGKLYSYLESPAVYHCPADKLRMGPDGTRLYTSYCVPDCLGGETNPVSARYSIQINKFNEITSPAMRYNFVESGEKDRGNWVAAGHFVMATPEYGDGGYGWWSPIAINHGDSSVFGFCDGHAEKQKWHDPDTFLHYAATATSSNYGKRMSEIGEDLGFLARGWAFRYRK